MAAVTFHAWDTETESHPAISWPRVNKTCLLQIHPGCPPGPGAVCVWCNSHGPTHGPESNGNTESLEQRYISLCLSGPGLSPPGTLKALGPTQDWFSSHRLTQAPRHKRGKRPSITPISLALSAHLAGLTPLCASLSMSKSHKTA